MERKKKIVCQWCDSLFASKRKLKAHVSDAHRDKLASSNSNADDPNETKPPSPQPLPPHQPPLNAETPEARSARLEIRRLLGDEQMCRHGAPLNIWHRERLKKIEKLKKEGYTLENTRKPPPPKKQEKPPTKKTSKPVSGPLAPTGSLRSRATATTTSTMTSAGGSFAHVGSPFDHKKKTVQSDDDLFDCDTSEGEGTHSEEEDHSSEPDDPDNICDDCLDDLASDDCDVSDDFDDFDDCDDCDDYDDYGDDF